MARQLSFHGALANQRDSYRLAREQEESMALQGGGHHWEGTSVEASKATVRKTWNLPDSVWELNPCLLQEEGLFFLILFHQIDKRD